jgi:hypothetical protein
VSPEDQRVGDLCDLDAQGVGSLPRRPGSIVEDRDLAADTEGRQGCGYATHRGMFENVLDTRIGHMGTVAVLGSRMEEGPPRHRG